MASCGSDLDSFAKDDKNTEAKYAKLLQITTDNSQNYLNYPAVVGSQQLRVLSFEVGGMVDEINVTEGQDVKKGTVLAKLNQQNLLSKLSSAKSLFKISNKEYQRSLRLIKQDAISRSKLEARRSQRDINKAQLDTAKKALQDSVIIAPFSGAISSISIEKRQVIAPGHKAITILGETGLEVKFNISSNIIVNSKKTDKSKFKPYIVLNAKPNLKIPAKFKEVSLEADSATQTYEITLSFDKQDGLNILPGMSAMVWFKNPENFNKKANKITIPLQSVGIEKNKNFVWIVDDKSKKVVKQYIKIKKGIGDKVTVLVGLNNGDTIVISGIYQLTEGMLVKAWHK